MRTIKLTDYKKIQIRRRLTANGIPALRAIRLTNSLVAMYESAFNTDPINKHWGEDKGVDNK